MQGIVHITPAIWLRDGERSRVCLDDADGLADWLGQTCARLMRSSTVGNGMILELEGLLARVEAVIDAGDPYLPADLHRDIVAAVARLNDISTAAAMPDDDEYAQLSRPSSPSAPGRTDAARQHGRPPLRLHRAAAGRQGPSRG